MAFDKMEKAIRKIVLHRRGASLEDFHRFLNKKRRGQNMCDFGGFRYDKEKKKK